MSQGLNFLIKKNGWEHSFTNEKMSKGEVLPSTSTDRMLPKQSVHYPNKFTLLYHHIIKQNLHYQNYFNDDEHYS